MSRGSVERSLSFGFFFFKQKTAYEISTRDWSSDVCSSDLDAGAGACGTNDRIVAAASGERSLYEPTCDGSLFCRNVPTDASGIFVPYELLIVLMYSFAKSVYPMSVMWKPSRLNAPPVTNALESASGPTNSCPAA